MRLRWLSLGFACFLAPDRADACSCVTESRPLEFLPEPGATLPTNGRVLLTLHGWGSTWPDGRAFSKDDVVLFRSKKSGGKTLDVSAKVSLAGGRWEIAPSAELAPNAVHELVLRAPKDGDRVVATYRTGPGPDRTAPRWEGGVVGKRYVGRPVSGGECELFGTSVQIETTPPIDAGSPGTPTLLFAVWLPDADGRIDFAHPPDQLVNGPLVGQTLRVDFGPGHKCLDRGIVCYPCERVGLRAVDAAGNVSAPREVSLGPMLRRVNW